MTCTSCKRPLPNPSGHETDAQRAEALGWLKRPWPFGGYICPTCEKEHLIRIAKELGIYNRPSAEGE